MPDFDLSQFNLSDAYEILGSLSILLVEIVIYSVFIFNFYRFLACRDIIKVDLNRYSNKKLKFTRGIGYIFQSVFLFPVIVFFWFAILAMFLGFLGKNQTTESILLVSIALVSAVRVAAYYNENLSRDLAKMMPFALLGIYLVDQSYFEFEVSLELMKSIPDYWTILVYYFVFIIALEFILRILRNVVLSLRKEQEDPSCISEPRNNDLIKE